MPITPATTSGGPPPHAIAWGGIFAKPDKVRQQFVILSASRKSDAIADDADLGLAKANLLTRMRQGIKYVWIRARETLAFDCVRLLMGRCLNVISLRSG